MSRQSIHRGEGRLQCPTGTICRQMRAPRLPMKGSSIPGPRTFVAKRVADEGAEVEIRTPANIRAMIKTDLAKWAKVAQDANMPKQ